MERGSIEFEYSESEIKQLIKVVGVGGGGGNAVTKMYTSGSVPGVSFLLCNTDTQALDRSPVVDKITIGPTVTKGLGAGAKPERAKEAALESEQAIRDALIEGDTRMVFITAGMGGGTGTGAAPIIGKIAMFSNVPKDCVVENSTMDCLYEAPLMLHRNGLDQAVCRQLGLGNDLSEDNEKLLAWSQMVDRVKHPKRTTRIAIAGKYVALHDAYLSIREALYHGGYANNAEVEVEWINTEEVTRENAAELFAGVSGILVPGGFGERGIEGMVQTCRYARENNIPYFGICLGMQISVIEYARNVAGISDANSGEFNENGKNNVIDLMEEQMHIVRKGGTMRLGAYPCKIAEGSVLKRAYGQDLIQERHRHRFEFNNKYRDILQEAGLTICGTSPDGLIVEAVEDESRRFHVGVQFHPEFKSRPNKPHPLFASFIKASLGD